MKGKTNIKMSAILAVLLLTLATFAVIPAHAVITPTMYIDPAYKNGGLEPGDTFTLTLMIKDFTDMYLWQAGITFNPAVLHCDSYDGGPTLVGDVFDVLAPAITSLFIGGTIDNVLGKVGFSSQGLTGAVPGVTDVSGTGYKLMVFHFSVVGYTDGIPATVDCAIAIVSMFVLDHTGFKTVPNVTGGQVETKAPPAPYGPTAKFTFFPGIQEINKDVTFDATSSKPGFDGTHMCPITEYRWDWNGDGIFEQTVATKVVTHQWAIAGDYDVTLEVYAPGATPDTSDVMHTVKILPPAAGAAIDLTSNKVPINGEGPNQASDSYAPQELMILYAKVTYNGEPVENKLVGFEVRDSNGDCVTYRVGATNALGIAEVEFRTPSMPAFGDWIAYAIVDVAGTTVGDTMPFRVGWIVQIISVTSCDFEGTPVSEFHKGEDMYFMATITNIALTTKTVTLTFVVYDACGVPLGQVVVPDWTIDADNTVSDFLTTVSILVPSWAFISPPPATVYANSFTDLPINNGVPTAPEVFTTFVISH
jgi:hypothetical protein